MPETEQPSDPSSQETKRGPLTHEQRQRIREGRDRRLHSPYAQDLIRRLEASQRISGDDMRTVIGGEQRNLD